jgi:hypothetical protein
MENSIKIIKAIKKINPNAKFNFGNDDLTTLEWTSGTTPIPVADIQAQIPTVEAEIEQEKQDSINKKASGKQKLLDLGLTEEEVKALIGV